MSRFLSGIICFTILITAATLAQVNQVDISKSPVLTFKEYCSRCHGDEGKAYGEGFANMNDDELKKVIEDMMFGPAFLNPEEIEIEAMTAYHKSLRDKKPFAIVLNSKAFLTGKEKGLIISISPGSKLEIQSDSKIKIIPEKDSWKLFYDPETLERIKITVIRNNAFSAFSFPDKLWTE